MKKAVPEKPVKTPKKRAARKTPRRAKAKPEPQYVNLRDAAVHCKAGENTLRRYISAYPDMPIHRRGVGREGYQFDLVELDKWREKHNLLKPVLLSGDNRQGVLPGISDERRKAKLEADLLQIKHDIAIRKLVDKQDIVKFLSTRISQLAKRLDALPAIIGRKAGLSSEVIEKIRRYTEESRVALVNDDGGYFSAEPELELEDPDAAL